MEQTTHTLAVPGAVLVYDVRGAVPGSALLLLLVGSPMGAAAFGGLAARFPDRTVATVDPRGVDRSRRTDRAPTATPEEHADDLHRLVAALGGGPVDLFATSGGAALLGTEPAVLPGGHTGFLAGGHGGTGDPDAFAARLRQVLNGWA